MCRNFRLNQIRGIADVYWGCSNIVSGIRLMPSWMPKLNIDQGLRLLSPRSLEKHYGHCKKRKCSLCFWAQKGPECQKTTLFPAGSQKKDPGWHAPVCRLQLTRNGKFVGVVCFAIISEIQKKYQYRPMVLPRRQQKNQASRQKESAVHLMGFFSNSSDVV